MNLKARTALIISNIENSMTQVGIFEGKDHMLHVKPAYLLSARRYRLRLDLFAANLA